MIMFFHTSAATGGMTKNGDMTRMRTMPWPHIGWSRSRASRMPKTMVMARTLMTSTSVFRIDWRKAGFE